MRTLPNDSLVFFREFLRKPTSIGAVTPSSPHLAKEIVRGLNLRDSDLVLEYGPGTGSFTRRILSDKGSATRFVVLEINSDFALRLRQAHPTLELYECSVERAPALLEELELPLADVVVSGLPWASFDSKLQAKLLHATRCALRPGGRFVTFAYAHGILLPSAHQFRERLHRTFSRVRYSRIVWGNLPPAFVYRCIR